MVGAGGSWKSGRGMMWWWELVFGAGASGTVGEIEIMAGAGAVGAEEGAVWW